VAGTGKVGKWAMRWDNNTYIGAMLTAVHVTIEAGLSGKLVGSAISLNFLRKK
jgi:hypothetical protein